MTKYLRNSTHTGFTNNGTAISAQKYDETISELYDESAIRVESMQGLLFGSNPSDLADGACYLVQNFYSDTTGGGDPWFWFSGGDKADHNGITVVDPTHPTTPGQLGWWTSENTGTTGVFIRVDKPYLSFYDAGIKADGTHQGEGMSALASLASNNSKIVFVNGDTFSIDPDIETLDMPSNSHWVWHKNAILESLESSDGVYTILNIGDESNVVLIMNGATIKGDRSIHGGTSGEQGHCLGIRNSDDIYIENGRFIDAWGDGIYIGGNDVNNNVKLLDPVCDNNRRQGISVITANGLTIQNPDIKNTSGTAPAAGIDIEPNLSTQVLKSVNIINPKTFNNSGGGIIIALSNFDNTTDPVSINITNHEEDGNGNSPNGLLVQRKSSGVDGFINVSEPVYKNNGLSGVKIREWDAEGAMLKIQNPITIDCNQDGGTTRTYNSAYTQYNEVGETQTIGGVTLIEPQVISTDGTHVPENAITFLNEDNNASLENVFIVNPRESDYNTRFVEADISSNYYLEDKYNNLVLSISADYTENNRDVYSKVVTDGIIADRRFRFSDRAISERETKIELKDDQIFSILYIDTGTGFLPYNRVALYANAKGSSITVKRQDGGYYITNQVGNWSFPIDFTDGDTTPDVRGGAMFNTANTTATTITDFDNGNRGQRITVIINDANTTIDFTSSGLKGNGGVDWSPSQGDHMVCEYDGTDWYCDINDNTA